MFRAIFGKCRAILATKLKQLVYKIIAMLSTYTLELMIQIAVIFFLAIFSSNLTAVPLGKAQAENEAFNKALASNAVHENQLIQQIESFYKPAFKLTRAESGNMNSESAYQSSHFYLGELTPVQGSRGSRKLLFTFFLKENPNYFVTIWDSDIPASMEGKDQTKDPLIGRAADFIKLIYSDQDKGKVAIVLGRRKDNNLWATPGGFFDLKDLTQGRPDFTLTAMREYKEEVGEHQNTQAIKVNGKVVGSLGKKSDAELLTIVFNGDRDPRWKTDQHYKAMASNVYVQRFTYQGSLSELNFQGQDDLPAAKSFVIDLTRPIKNQLVGQLLEQFKLAQQKLPDANVQLNNGSPMAFDHQTFVLRALENEAKQSSMLLNGYYGTKHFVQDNSRAAAASFSRMSDKMSGMRRNSKPSDNGSASPSAAPQVEHTEEVPMQ